MGPNTPDARIYRGRVERASIGCRPCGHCEYRIGDYLMATELSAVDGISYDDTTATAPNPGITPGKRLKVLGQTVNKATGAVANQQIGTVDLPILAAGATGTVAVSNSQVTANSLIFVSVANETAAGAFAGDTTAGRCVDAWIESVGSGTFTIGYHATAAMSADWSVYYLIFN